MILFKFDLHSAYHFIDIFEPHTIFLGFVLQFEGNTKFFQVYCITIWSEFGLLYIYKSYSSLSQDVEGKGNKYSCT